MHFKYTCSTITSFAIYYNSQIHGCNSIDLAKSDLLYHKSMLKVPFTYSHEIPRYFHEKRVGGHCSQNQKWYRKDLNLEIKTESWFLTSSQKGKKPLQAQIHQLISTPSHCIS